MNLKKFGFLFFSTAVIGMIIGLLTTLSGQFGTIRVVWGIITGGFLSASAMMAFWGYLTLNFTMRTFVSFRIWASIQVLLIGVVYYDMVYFRYMWMAKGEGSIWPYVFYATWPLVVAMVAAYFKGRISGMRSFIPSVFFLYVFTVLEWFVALKSGQQTHMNQIGVILLGVNIYILFMYTRLLKIPIPAKQPAPKHA